MTHRMTFNTWRLYKIGTNCTYPALHKKLLAFHTCYLFSLRSFFSFLILQCWMSKKLFKCWMSITFANTTTQHSIVNTILVLLLKKHFNIWELISEKIINFKMLPLIILARIKFLSSQVLRLTKTIDSTVEYMNTVCFNCWFSRQTTPRYRKWNW